MLRIERFFINLERVRGDIFGGVTAAIVALPLALAFGVASGAGAASGLYGAILVGFFAALFGGTSTQVSGPTGPMTVVMTAIIMQYAADPYLAFAVVILGGGFQIIFGLVGLGKYVTYIPYPVVSGFMSGIGCIIIILQLAPLFGIEQSQAGIFGSITDLPKLVRDLQFDPLLIGLLTLTTIVIIPNNLKKILPPPLFALVVGSVIGSQFFLDAPTIGEIPRSLPSLLIPKVELSHLIPLAGSALILATLGTIDSLLTSLVADKLTRTQHNSKKELIGQGIGNIVAGFFGGIPGAGATMRTVVNIKAGANSCLSGVLHALILALVLLGFAPIAEKIPLAVLAGILLKVGWDIIDWDYLRRINKRDFSGFLIMATVLTITVLVDLVIAVAIGVILQFFLSAQKRKKIEISDIKSTTKLIDDTAYDNQISVRVVSLNGSLSFCSVKHLSAIISDPSKNNATIIDMKNLNEIDTSVALAINDTLIFGKEKNIAIFIVGMRDPIKKYLQELKIIGDNNVGLYSKFEDAVASLKGLKQKS